MENLSESQSNFTVRFCGSENIDALTLATSLSNFVGAIKDITNETHPGAIAKLNVVSTQRGSFEIDLVAIIKYIPTLFTKDNITVASHIILMFLNMLLIKKHLAGKPPWDFVTEGDTSYITNHKDQRISVPKQTANTYFGSPTIDNRTVNVFTALKADENRDDLTIESDDGELKIEFTKEEYEDMSVKVVEDVQAAQDIHSHIINVTLLLKKPDLLGKSKWGFVFDKVIEAVIKDSQWLSKVQNGEIKNLYAGVKIPVRLLIEVELDEKKSPTGEPKYTVLEVTGDVIEPIKSGNLFEK